MEDEVVKVVNEPKRRKENLTVKTSFDGYLN